MNGYQIKLDPWKDQNIVTLSKDEFAKTFQKLVLVFDHRFWIAISFWTFTRKYLFRYLCLSMPFLHFLVCVGGWMGFDSRVNIGCEEVRTYDYLCLKYASSILEVYNYLGHL